MAGDRVPHVLVTGIVSAGPSGVRDYGNLLGQELNRSGTPTEVCWAVNEDGRLRTAMRATHEQLTIARRTNRGTTVVWNYTPGSTGYRGLPGISALLGLQLRMRRVAVIVVLHELAEPWRGQPVSTRVRSLAAVVALVPVLLGSGVWVTTTEGRARRLWPLGRLLRRNMRFVPVFSNLGEGLAVCPPREADGFLIGVLDYAATFARPDIVIQALVELQASGPAQMVLLGAPGPGSSRTTRWTDLATAAGVGDAVELSGIMPLDQLGHRLDEMDVVVLPNAQGPASRKGTLAAALAHRRPVVSLDGPMRWDRLVDAQAVLVVAPEAAALADTLRRLRGDRAERARLGAAAGSFYVAEMSVARAATAFRELVQRQGPPPHTCAP
jgi:glycosyltransferase involved in cell wall biosynthesis